MSQRSAGVFSIHPTVFPEMHQIKAGVTNLLQTSVVHLAVFAPTSLLCVTSSSLIAVPAISTVQRRFLPHQLVVSECVSACLGKQLDFVLSIYGREGGGSV